MLIIKNGEKHQKDPKQKNVSGWKNYSDFLQKRGKQSGSKIMLKFKTSNYHITPTIKPCQSLFSFCQ
jgi:hypothetical protein